MNLQFPNRVAESGGLYDATLNQVALSGQAMAGFRSCAAAVTAGALVNGDVVGVALVSSDGSRWAVWSAFYDQAGASLQADTVEDASSTPLVDGESVTVTLCATAQMLRWLADGPPARYGLNMLTPNYWDGGEWDSETSAYFGNPDLAVSRDWATGFRPESAEIDVYVPDPATGGWVQIQMVDPDGSTFSYAYVDTSSLTEGWNTLSLSISFTTGKDLARFQVSFASEVGVRNLVFSESP